MSANEVIRQAASAFNGHDSAALAALYAPTAVVHDPMYPDPLEGREAVEEDVTAFFRAFPDLSFSVQGVIDAGDDYAYRGTMMGTHQGPLAVGAEEIPPTGRSFRFEGAVLGRLDGQGRILEEHRYYDFAGLLAQIGAAA